MRYTRRQLADASRVGPYPIVSFIIESFPARCFVNVRVDIKMKGKDNKKDERERLEEGAFLEEFPLGLVVRTRSPEANWQGSK